MANEFVCATRHVWLWLECPCEGERLLAPTQTAANHVRSDSTHRMGRPTYYEEWVPEDFLDGGSPTVENRRPGILEYWNNGILGACDPSPKGRCASGTHHSTIPLFQYSRFVRHL